MDSRFKARQLAGLALLTSLQAALLYVSALLPSARLAAVAVAGTVSAAAVIASGVSRALMVFAASALLSLLIVPDKGNVLLFAAFFGYYPILKSVFERQKNTSIRWLLKLLLFNAVFFCLWFLAKNLIVADMPEYMTLIFVAMPLCNAAFVVYDIGLGKLISYYIARISGIGGSR